jgi:hypothetical protein
MLTPQQEPFSTTEVFLDHFSLCTTWLHYAYIAKKSYLIKIPFDASKKNFRKT